MFSWILALLLALSVWGLTSAWLWMVKRRRTETQHGLAALAGMRWREFSQIVRRAMAEQRGLRDLSGEDNGDRGTSSDFLMERDGQRWLLSCKHGRAYRISAPAITELGAALRLTGATGGILITEGRVERDGLAAAEKESIEVLDGRVLWQVLLRPACPRTCAPWWWKASPAARRCGRPASRALGAAVAVGLLAGMGYMTLQIDENLSRAPKRRPQPWPRRPPPRARRPRRRRPSARRQPPMLPPPRRRPHPPRPSRRPFPARGKPPRKTCRKIPIRKPCCATSRPCPRNWPPRPASSAASG